MGGNYKVLRIKPNGEIEIKSPEGNTYPRNINDMSCLLLKMALQYRDEEAIDFLHSIGLTHIN